ncbi:hypothetical protein F2Q69_00051968 [Brassica cretica]|uniref:Uncharacterized protein n=1 Tax=Brassica cretica TaxID=69181 RepID=A0A8S9MWT7_BRACR|nr:hypothetical protein F2Q69_00051968 [Brassica cretica]
MRIIAQPGQRLTYGWGDTVKSRSGPSDVRHRPRPSRPGSGLTFRVPGSCPQVPGSYPRVWVPASSLWLPGRVIYLALG